MQKFLIILSFILVKSFLLNESYTPIQLHDFSKTNFSLENEYVIFSYENSVQKIFAHSIYFIFDKGEKSSTKIYLYDSLDKITRGDIGFINHVYETTLKQTKYFEISSEASYYKDKHIYYIVLYDIATTYSDAIYVLNSLNYLPFGEEISYKTYFNLDLNFYFIIQKSYSTYLHYQTNAISGHSSDTYDLKIINNNGDILVEQNKVGFNGYLKIESNVKYFVHMLILAIILNLF